jgi:hypothetical protein
MILAVPAATPVTKPVVAFTVAIAGAEELQLPPETVELYKEVLPIQMACVPPNAPAVGGAVTVT